MGSPWADDAAPATEAGQSERASALESWVAWYVETYEAWEQVPACWASHPAMVGELEAAMDLRLGIDTQTAGDVLAAGRGRADWHDYRGRMMERLAATPGAACAQRGEHREPRSWDREASSERRRQARRAERARIAG